MSPSSNSNFPNETDFATANAAGWCGLVERFDTAVKDGALEDWISEDLAAMELRLNEFTSERAVHGLTRR